MDEDGFSIRSQLPLAGVVFCCTSIAPERRSELANIAVQMGGDHQLDLTSDVTHLLVGDVNTPKYKYVAKEREDVKVLRPEWINAVRESWMQGEDADVEVLERQYRLPTFEGLSVCLTGFDDLSFRTKLQSEILANGGHYTGDLTKSVTHLIAHVPQGKKYQFAQQWGIRVVTLKWFRDSLERGMILEETSYHPTIAEKEQGIGAWNRLPSKSTTLGKRGRGDESLTNHVRKLRRTASAKLGSQNKGLWSDIVGGGFSVQPQQGQQWDEDERPIRPPVRSRSMIVEPKSFINETTVRERGDSMVMKDQTSDSGTVTRGFLHGRTFFLYGFTGKKIAILEKHLIENDGQVVLSLQDLPDKEGLDERRFILVPHTMPVEKILPAKQLDRPAVLITEMWLERCLHNKRFETPDSHIVNQPFSNFPIPDFDRVRICSSGFPGIELLHLSKVVNLMGAMYEEDLTPDTSLLILKSPTDTRKEKLRHAYEWKIPTVSAEWLWDSVRRSHKLPLHSYHITTPQYIVDEVRAARTELEKLRKAVDQAHDPKPIGRKLDNQDGKQQRASSIQPKEWLNAQVSRQDKHLIKGQPADPIIPSVPLSRNTPSTTTPSTSGSKATAAGSNSSEVLVPTLPLQERSANSPPKPSTTFSPSPPSEIPDPSEAEPEEMTRASAPILTSPPNSAATTTTTNPLITNDATTDQKPESKRSALNSILTTFLSRKKSKTNPSNPGRAQESVKPEPAHRTRRRSLLGRANSSSSSAMQASAATGEDAPRISRTNSITSINSDGIGSLINTQSQNHQTLSGAQAANTDATAIDAAAQILKWQSNSILPPHLRPDESDANDADGRDDSANEGIILTQLGYDNVSDAREKKEKEKEKRREEGKVKDVEGMTGLMRMGRGSDASLGRGGRRRRVGKER